MLKIIKYIWDLFLYHGLNICPKCHERLLHFESKFGLTKYKACPNCDKEYIDNIIKINKK